MNEVFVASRRWGRRLRRGVRCAATIAVAIAQLACQASGSSPAPPPPKPAVEVGAASANQGTASSEVRYDLGRDERRGGHTLARHVGRSDEELRQRLQQERRISAASTYTDRTTAERVVAQALAINESRIDRWMAREGPRPNLTLNYHAAGDAPIGRTLARQSRQALDCFDALVVLRWDGQSGFYVLTSYPERRR